MKQTNNAIKFLMAQYRAIFKNAYFKGMATALVLTAGLAAGQAQAADSDFWTLSKSDQVNWTNQPTAISSAQHAAGAFEDSNSNIKDSDNVSHNVSNGSLTVGTADGLDVDSVLGNALGGWIYNTDAALSDIVADNNKVTLSSGGTVGDKLAGVMASAKNANLTATQNKAIVSGGSVTQHVYGASLATSGGNVTANENTATIYGGSVGYSVYGASISTEKGSATASGNQAIVKADVADTISIGNNNWNAIRGVRAEATDTISLTGNSVSVEISDANTADAITQLTFDKANTLEGALGVIASGGTGAQAVISRTSKLVIPAAHTSSVVVVK